MPFECILFYSAPAAPDAPKHPDQGAKRSFDKSHEAECEPPKRPRHNIHYKENSGSGSSDNSESESSEKAGSVKSVQIQKNFKAGEENKGNEEAIQKLRLELSKERRISRQAQTEVTSLRLRLNVWEQAFKMFAAKVKSDAATPGKTFTSYIL